MGQKYNNILIYYKNNGGYFKYVRLIIYNFIGTLTLLYVQVINVATKREKKSLRQ